MNQQFISHSELETFLATKRCNTFTALSETQQCPTSGTTDCYNPDTIESQTQCVLNNDDSDNIDYYYKSKEYSFGRYQATKRRTMHFPRSVLAANVPEIREFDDPQNQLYYFLSWTSKMAMIDGEFIYYTFQDRQFVDIAIFNAELHDKHNNAVLYVVAVSNEKERNDFSKPRWRMESMMTAHQIYSMYGVDECDLPIGSRYKHNYFQSQINEHHQRLQEIVYVNNWNKVRIISQQKTKGKSGKLIDFESVDLNECINESIEEIKNKNGNLSLIPILQISASKGKIYCDPLIPIKLELADKTKWIAVSYKTSTIRPYKAVVTGLHLDAEDVINKSSLVDPNAVRSYRWLKEEESDDIVPETSALCDNYSTDSCLSSISDTSLPSSPDLKALASDQWTIQSLQQQLNACLNREHLLIEMMKQRDVQIHQLQTVQNVPSTHLSSNSSSSSSINMIQNVPNTQLSPSSSFIHLPSIQLSNLSNLSNSNIVQYPSPIPTPNLLSMTPPNINNMFSYHTHPSLINAPHSLSSFPSIQIPKCTKIGTPSK